jgi:hypothetical protein
MPSDREAENRLKQIAGLRVGGSSVFGRIKMAKLMMFRPWKMLLILILFIICSGCAVYYIPQPYPIKPEMIPDFSVSHAVTIVNAQTDKTFKAPKCPDRLIMGNLRKWTGTAVEVLKTELKKMILLFLKTHPKS